MGAKLNTSRRAQGLSMRDPAALAARLAEIRATVAALTLDGRMPVGIAADLSDLLAAYDARYLRFTKNVFLDKLP